MAIKASRAVIASGARTVRAGAAPTRTSRPGIGLSWRARTVMFRHPIQWFLVRHRGWTPKQAKGFGAGVRKLFTPQTEEAKRWFK